MGRELGLGKVTREVFDRSVLPFIPIDKELELDGATVRLTDHTVISHSPSIGVPIDALGFFAFHYAASNVACKFGRPTHVITGIYLPLNSSENDLKTIAVNLGNEAKKYSVDIVAGQTATYYGLEIPFVSTTCLGELLKRPARPEPGDLVFLVGEVSGEAVWLTDLSKGVSDDRWRNFTGLPAILLLQKVEGVKLIHDVSEGGVKGALIEALDSLGLRLDFQSSLVTYAKGTDRLNIDLLRTPTYGAVIIVVKPDSEENVVRICREHSLPLSRLGLLQTGSGLYVDGEQVTDRVRVEIDELYGAFRRKDDYEEALSAAFYELERIDGAEKLIPEVGLNMVYCKPSPAGPIDVAGLNGRVIVSKNRPKACGEVEYGGSRFLSSVVVEANRRKPALKAAVVLRGGENVAKALRSIGKRVIVLPPNTTEASCPVAQFISSGGTLAEAYSHPGAHGIEPTTVIIAKEPAQLISTLRELLKHV